MYEKKPWLKYYGSVPEKIDYPKITMFQSLMRSVEKNPDVIAYDFLGTKSSYINFASDINKFANVLAGIGLKKGDRVTISMPTSPQGIICFYAVNKLGGVANMIHPLSTAEEVKFYLNKSESKFALTLDAFFEKFKSILGETNVEKLILTKLGDYLSPFMRFGFYIKKGRKIPSVPVDPQVVWWKALMNKDFPEAQISNMSYEDLAVILYSGGTTGAPKGVMLSNRNFICEGMQVAEWGRLSQGGHEDSILAILPIFHGFGLGVCVNGAFMGGSKSILVPQFTASSVAKLIKKKKPSILIGVPTLFEALNRNKHFKQSDLSCLKACFCGADTLTSSIKNKFETIVKNQGGGVKLLEGYGMTEAVTAIMATPMNEYRKGSIGIPFPDMLAKVVKIDTFDEAALDEDGEICIHGPAVMLGYLDNPDETEKVLRKHPDGKTWLHSGDIGSMDKDGFFYFKLRQKRMIKSSGMNVYPTQVEERLSAHPAVAEVCVIGVPDDQQIEKVKAFVVPEDGVELNDQLKQNLMDHCAQNLIKWSCPREVEFRTEMPKTLIGKIDFRTLEIEEAQKTMQQYRSV